MLLFCIFFVFFCIMLKIKIKDRTRYATTVAFRNWPPTAQTAAPGWNGATLAGSRAPLPPRCRMPPWLMNYSTISLVFSVIMQTPLAMLHPVYGRARRPVRGE